MLADYRTTGMSVGTHPPRTSPPTSAGGDTLERRAPRAATWQAGGRSGDDDCTPAPFDRERIVFMLLEDEHGQVNLIVPPPIYERHELRCARSRSSLPVAATSEWGEPKRPRLRDRVTCLLARQVADNDTVWSRSRGHTRSVAAELRLAASSFASVNAVSTSAMCVNACGKLPTSDRAQGRTPPRSGRGSLRRDRSRA